MLPMPRVKLYLDIGLKSGLKELTKRFFLAYIFFGEARFTESRVGTDPLTKFPLQDTPVAAVCVRK